MADYWKSNPRKYCDVCKCWFGDNKASIEFHERGRRHKENVKKLLSSARQRSAENEKKEAKTNEMLAAIEMAAAAAYVRDLGGDEGDAAKTTKKKKSSLQQAAAPPPQPQIEEPFQLKKARAHLEILDTIQKRQEKTERETAKRLEESGPPPPPPSQWQQAATPDGQHYYYNIFTRETQWVEPPDFLPLPPKSPTNHSATPPTFLHAGSEAGGGDEGEGRKRSLEAESEPPAKRPAGPYGEWTTVAIHPRQPEAEDATEETAADESSDDDNLDSEEEREDKDDEEETLSFNERTVNSLPPGEAGGGDRGAVTVGSFKGFGFRKRSTAARPQIRQRTSELS